MTKVEGLRKRKPRDRTAEEPGAEGTAATAASAQESKPKAPAVERIVVEGVEHLYVTDARGRRFGLRKMKPSERFAVNEVVDPKTMSAAITALMVGSIVSIDEEGWPPLKGRADFLKRLDEIDDAGSDAVTAVVLNLYGLELTDKALDTAKN